MLAGHRDEVSHAAFSPNGRRILTASDDGTARLWDSTTGEEIAILRQYELISLISDIVSLKIMLSNQFLDEETLDKALALQDTTPERVSRLWRGFDAASDAARALVNTYNCSPGKPEGEHCALVPELYVRAARALSLVVDIGGTIQDSGEVANQVAYGVGLGALHFAQDQNFRNFARRYIKLSELIREAEKATELRARSPRYPVGLAMLYCLDKDFERATGQIAAIRDKRKKYQYVKQQVLNCNQAAGSRSSF